MEFKDWLTQTKVENPELDDFLTKLDRFFVDTGFNASGFGKAVDVGLAKVDSEIEALLKSEDDVESQKNND